MADSTCAEIVKGRRRALLNRAAALWHDWYRVRQAAPLLFPRARCSCRCSRCWRGCSPAVPPLLFDNSGIACNTLSALGKNARKVQLCSGKK